MNGLVPLIQNIANNINKLSERDIDAIRKIEELNRIIEKLLIKK